MKIIITMLIIIGSSMASTQANDPTKHPTDLIESGVRDYVESALYQAGGDDFAVDNVRIDPRLHLNYCYQPIEYFTKSPIEGRSYITVGVRCPQQDGWTIYVSTSVSQYAEIYVAAHDIRRGDTITADAIELKRVDATSVRGQTIDDPRSVIGSRAKRRISAGKALLPRNLCVICKGELVNIVAENASGSLKLSMNGKAMTDGAVGEVIRVRNAKTNRVIEATISAPGEVTIVI